ncbi:Ribonuclease Z [Toxocara canis]|uniref:ribonuclease Z n=1 Tax=Toxocara canis TaxID=6265 RepID=A0A0B2V8L7_TOXCA|nr:Ribonuclease Z [Toxocara canis]
MNLWCTAVVLLPGSFVGKANFAVLRPTKLSRLFASRSRRPPPPSDDTSEKIYEDLNQRIDKFRSELNKYARSSFRSRLAANSLSNLQAAINDMKEKQKKQETVNSTAAIPSNVTLEVLSNGTTHVRPCILIRTPFKVYLFNCPEGTTRFLPSLRLKSLNVCDIFATRGTWDHIGGISSVLLSKEQGAQLTRLHGPVDIKHFLECIRPFTDSDFVTTKYPAQVEERPLEMGSYKDAALTVHYLPVSGLRSATVDDRPQRDLNRPIKPVQGVDIAYLIKLNAAPRRVDPTKLIELRVPSGPIIGRLKNGESITLDDGRTIKPEDILFSESAKEDPNVLIVECVDLEAVESLRDNSLLQKFIRGEEKMNFVVHFTRRELFDCKEYNEWMDSFGAHCTHIVLNGSGPILPHIESIYRNHAILNHLNPNLFPPLLGSHFDGVVGQDDKCTKQEGNRLYAHPLQRFALRGSLNTEDPITIVLKQADLENKLTQTDAIKKIVSDFKNVPQGKTAAGLSTSNVPLAVFGLRAETEIESAACEMDDKCTKQEGNRLYAHPLQRFALRGSLNTEDPITIVLKQADLENKLTQTDAIKKIVSDFKNECMSMECSSEMPRISFLGTSSAVPSKYRNVSGYLLQLSDSSSLMVDCGEGSYGQLRVLFGEQRCVDILLSLNAVFITHAHQDHMNGLYTVIARRHEAFINTGVNYRPLVLVCNFNVLNPLRTYSRCFCDLESLVNVVNISTRSPAPRNRDNSRNRLRNRDISRLSGTMDVVKLMPRPLFSETEWGLRSILAVQVHHTRMANGFVFLDSAGRKIVFSGDTKPCDLLVEHGMNADLLIHEATFEDDHERDAALKKHSTMKQAVDVGVRMRAKHILLSHFSARYPKVPALPQYLDEVGNISVAVDNLSVRFGDLALLPKLVSVFRELYQEELFEIQLRMEQRTLKKQAEEEQKHKGAGDMIDVDRQLSSTRKRRAAGDPPV